MFEMYIYCSKALSFIYDILFSRFFGNRSYCFDRVQQYEK